MQRLIQAAIQRSRATLLALFFLLMGGWASYVAIPKEAFPDIAIPFIYVSMSLEGISPEDAERQNLSSASGRRQAHGRRSSRQALGPAFDARSRPRQIL